jgi:UDP-perosamine 4-acetyltransferase
MKPVSVHILGGGGHACVALATAQAIGLTVAGYYALEEGLLTGLGIPYLGTDETLRNGTAPASLQLVNGVGSIRAGTRRSSLFESLTAAGFRFVTLRHPAAVIAADATLGEGTQVMAGAAVQVGTSLGRNVIVNTNATVEHHNLIADHVHIGPGATLCADITIGARSHIGAGSVVLQGRRIGSDVTVGAGSVVLSDLSDGVTVVGNPARAVSKPLAHRPEQ